MQIVALRAQIGRIKLALRNYRSAFDKPQSVLRIVTPVKTYTQRRAHTSERQKTFLQHYKTKDLEKEMQKPLDNT